MGAHNEDRYPDEYDSVQRSADAAEIIDGFLGRATMPLTSKNVFQ